MTLYSAKVEELEMTSTDRDNGSKRLGKLALALMALLILVFAIGCGGGGDGDGDDEAAGTDGAEVACADGDSTGISDDTILLGNTNILTGPIGFIGRDANEAMEAVFEQVNANGGIDGRQIELVSYDDQYDTSKALDGARRLTSQDQIFAWAGGVGTPTYLAIAKLLEQAGVPGITPFAPARTVGTSEHPLTYMTWANFQAEFYVTAKYLIENEGMGSEGNDVAFVRFDTEHGEDALIGTNKALEEIGAEVVLDVPTPTDESDYDSVALQVKQSGAKWIGMQLSSENGGNLLQAMKRVGYSPNVFTQSDYSDPTFAENFPEVAEGVYGSLQVRTFEKPVNETLKKHIADLKQATGADMTTWRAVGYLQGLLTVEALQNMEAPTRECLVEALQNIKDFDTGIQAPITFGPDQRMGVDALSVFQIRNGKVVQLLPFESNPLIREPFEL